MNLPLVLDVVIGLVFIFLTLSLLASEVQELITTLLQWRAKHLKQAIEILLAGMAKPSLDQPSAEDQAVQAQIVRSQELAASLYNHPLIRSLNQESKGLLGAVAQWISQLTQTSKIFSGKSSGPSYLPSETFSTTLLETLRTEDLIQKLSELKLDNFTRDRLLEPVIDLIGDLRSSKANHVLLEHELQKFQAGLTTIAETFCRRETTLTSSFNQAVSNMKRLIAAAEAVLPEDDPLSTVFLKRLAAVEQELPSLLQESGPSIIEVVSELNNMSWVAALLKEQGISYQALLARLPDDARRQQFQTGYRLLQEMNAIVQGTSQGRENYEAILAKVSPNLRDSLYMLAKRAQTKITTIEQGANQLQQEVAAWFDASMDRSSGVYKRNAKGVAIVIGFLVAITTNTDTLHIINRLSKDATLRTAYTQAASQLVSNNPATVACLEAGADRATQTACLQSGGVNANAANLRQALEETSSLPLGWSAVNWQDQWQPTTRGSLVSGLRIGAGWLVSAIAISMGAPFWFNLLNKIVNVRNSGKPPTTVQDSSSK